MLNSAKTNYLAADRGQFVPANNVSLGVISGLALPSDDHSCQARMVITRQLTLIITTAEDTLFAGTNCPRSAADI